MSQIATTRVAKTILSEASLIPLTKEELEYQTKLDREFGSPLARVMIIRIKKAISDVVTGIFLIAVLIIGLTLTYLILKYLVAIPVAVGIGLAEKFIVSIW